MPLVTFVRSEYCDTFTLVDHGEVASWLPGEVSCCRLNPTVETPLFEISIVSEVSPDGCCHRPSWQQYVLLSFIGGDDGNTCNAVSSFGMKTCLPPFASNSQLSFDT
eukprot:902695-Prorocentrum_lima.AAC.1